MSERKKIEERLRKKEQEVQVLEDKLRTAHVYVGALRDVLKLIDDEPEQNSEIILRSGSAVAQARDVILQIGEPIHINDIMKALGKEATREQRASLTSSLAAYVRRNEIFSRPAPNTFGLLELGHKTAEESDSEPPAGFGRVKAAEPSAPAEPKIAPRPPVPPPPPLRVASIPTPVAKKPLEEDDDIPF